MKIHTDKTKSATMSVFEEMWREQKLCDALLNVAGTQFWAHKLVLCDCSTFFISLFTRQSSPDCQEFDIAVAVSADIMKIILDYAYTRVVQVTQENLMELFEAADFFDMNGITQACYQAMAERLSPSSCIATWELTNTYYNPHLRNQAFLYILKHFEVMANSNAFLCLSMENLCSIIVEDQLNVRRESIVFEAVLKWIGHAPQERSKYLANLLSKLRLTLVHSEDLSQPICDNMLIQNEIQGDTAWRAEVMRRVKLKQNPYASLFPPYWARPRLPQEVLLALSGCEGKDLTVRSYDNRANRWVDVANCDETLTSHCNFRTVFFHGSVYLIGGHNCVHDLCTTHKYDLSNHTLQEVAPMHTPRCNVSVALLDGFIYAMGGSNELESLNTAEKYFPDTNQWTMIAPMKEKRANAGSTAYNRKIYICGGRFIAELLSTVECYNPLTNQWTMISPMSSRCEGVGVIAYFNEIYVLGGYNGQSLVDTVEAYNPNTNTWRPLPSMLTCRSDFGIGVVEDKLYAVSSGVESFDGKTGVWSRVCNTNVPWPRPRCCVVYDLPNMADYSAAHSSPSEEVPRTKPGS